MSLGLLCAILLVVIIRMGPLLIKKTQMDQENHRLTSENNDLMKKNSILTAEKEKLQNTVREYSIMSD